MSAPPANAPPKPDGLYGLSKAFGEDVAQLYFDRHGIETVSLRIGSSFAVPRDRRMLHTWMSFDDMERLVLAALVAKDVGHSTICGVSGSRVCNCLILARIRRERSVQPS